MHPFIRKFLTTAASVSAIAMFAGTALGQATKVEVEKPVFDDLPSPDIQISKSKSFKPKDWLEIETKLKVSMRPEPATKTCDKLTVKWYIAIKNPEKSGTFLLLSKEVTHVNIPLDEDVYASIYLSPASIKRITGTDKGGKNAVEYVGFEVLVNGEKVAQETNKGQPAWWNAASDKISRSEAVPLLTKSETPFSLFWWDRYAEVLAERR